MKSDKLEKATLKELTKLQEMAVRVGIIEKGDYLIYVNTDDSGNIPHFHCVDNNTGGQKFNTCIRIDKPEYFLHGYKIDTITNGRERKALDTFLRQPFSKPKFNGTNWEYIVMIWNMNNSSVEVDETMEQPDYTKLK